MTRNHGSQERAVIMFIHQRLQKEPTLPTPPFQASDFLKGLEFSCFKPLALWHIIIAVWQINTRSLGHTSTSCFSILVCVRHSYKGCYNRVVGTAPGESL